MGNLDKICNNLHIIFYLSIKNLLKFINNFSIINPQS
jgi:hypothetical protein